MKRLPLVLAFLAACGGASDDLAVAKIDTLPNGRIQVTNTGPTEWQQGDGWHFAEVLTVKPPEESPGELADIRAVAADSRGNIYVFQDRPTAIKKYGAEGEWIMDIGREGEGPGEYKSGMFTLVRDTPLVQDPNTSRITTFTPDGRFISTARSRCCYWNSRFAVLDDGTALIPGQLDDQGAALFRTRLDGVVVDTIPFPSFEPITSGSKTTWLLVRQSPGSSSAMGIDVPNQPRSIQRHRFDGKVFSGSTASYSFAIGSGYADTAIIVSAPGTTRQMTDPEIDSVYRIEMEKLGSDWEEIFLKETDRNDIPREVRPWHEVAFDLQNRIYIGVPGPGTDVAAIDVFTPDGVLLGRVTAPHPKILNGYFTTNRVYLADEDEDGYPMIRVYQLTKSR